MTNFHTYTLEALQKMQITTFTTIQQQVFSHINKKEDIYAISPTGSGKTLAYLLPILDEMLPQGKQKHLPTTLILAPTRELCVQITHVIRSILQNREGIRTALLTGGYDIQKQIQSFRKGADIVVGTPSRIKDHIRRHTLKLKQCDKLIIDEADMMVSMGFLNDVIDIHQTMIPHQTMVFSATNSKELKQFVSTYMHTPFQCMIEKESYLTQDVTTTLIEVQEKQKLDILQKYCQSNKAILIFCNTKKTCDFVCECMQKKGFDIDTIHSDMDYIKRKKIMERFRDGKLQILCATDVAGRGIDIPTIDFVILYDLPETVQQLIHRSGRAGRAFHFGQILLFVTPSQKQVYDFKQLFPNIQYTKKTDEIMNASSVSYG